MLNNPNQFNNDGFIEAEESDFPELTDSQKQKLGGTAFRSFDTPPPTREKIYHPSRGRLEQARALKENEKIRDIELSERRASKIKYAHNFSNPRKAAAADFRANLPNFEVIEENAPKEHEAISLKETSKKLLNYYEKSISNDTAAKWLQFGMTTAIEEGKFNPSVDTVLKNGFWAREREKIHHRLDPDDTSSYDAIDAERDVKVRIYRDILDEYSKKIPKSEIDKLKYDSSIYAIRSGARIDEESGKVIYSIPFEKGKEVTDFFQANGVNLDKYNDKKEAIIASYEGFANIINTIKDIPRETKRGFEALDWYFDSFGYSSHMESFLNEMDYYQENTDESWNTKFEEYLSHRHEYQKFLEQEEARSCPQIENIEELSVEDLMKDFDHRLNLHNEALAVELFPDASSVKPRIHRGLSKPRNLPPTSIEKYSKFIAEYQQIKSSDPGVNVYRGFVKDSLGNKKEYRIIRFGRNDYNVAIVCPIENASNDAAYVWAGQTGDDKEAWRNAFTREDDSDSSVDKYSVRKREDVKAVVHRAALKTRGLNALDNMWFNIYRYIEKKTA